MTKLTVLASLFVLSAASASVTARSANARDEFRILHGQRGHQLVNLRGVAEGTTKELFTILERAGLPARPTGEGKILDGRRLSASVAFMNGANYNASFRIVDGAATVNLDESNREYALIQLRGDVAEELFDAMAKAGVPHHQYHEGISYLGRFSRCNSFVMRGSRLSLYCEIRVIR
ncbi:MAG: hypothetical protein HY075_01320 [Deltaproteobacteria bacterium]|nr:hypothetical protein [Deltaproteobacteria bacterium]